MLKAAISKIIPSNKRWKSSILKYTRNGGRDSKETRKSNSNGSTALLCYTEYIGYIVHFCVIQDTRVGYTVTESNRSFPNQCAEQRILDCSWACFCFLKTSSDVIIRQYFLFS